MKMVQFPEDSKDNDCITLEKHLHCNNGDIANEIKIEVYKGARTFGLVLEGSTCNQQSPSPSGIYVSKVQEGGLAEVDGRIIPGDRIMAIRRYLDNGDAYTFNLDNDSNITHEGAKQLLRRCKGKVAIFISRTNDQPCHANTRLDQSSQDLINEPSTENRVKSMSETVKSNQSNKENDKLEHISKNSVSGSCLRKRENEGMAVSFKSSNTTLPNSALMEDKKYASTVSRIKLLNVSTLIDLNNSPALIGGNTTSTKSLDYRDMAKYGIRPTSSISTNVIQPTNNNVKQHRVKASWISSSISRLSIAEDDEEKFIKASISQVQTIIDCDSEQRVL